MNEFLYVVTSIISETKHTREFTSRPVLQLCFIKDIYCFNLNVEPCPLIKTNYLQIKICIFYDNGNGSCFQLALFSLLAASEIILFIVLTHH